jgi:hypothetical protein
MDIHSGGIDLRFPHHENEIAQVVREGGGEGGREGGREGGTAGHEGGKEEGMWTGGVSWVVFLFSGRSTGGGVLGMFPMGKLLDARR